MVMHCSTPKQNKFKPFSKFLRIKDPMFGKQKDWDKLFDDIVDNEAGYFVGAILSSIRETEKNAISLFARLLTDSKD